MFYIEDDAIYLTRGDDAILDVRISADGEAYTMEPEDTLTLTVRASPGVENPIILSASSTPGSTRILIPQAYTVDTTPGQYSADVQLVTANGNRYTVWPRLKGRTAYSGRNYKNFVIMTEVTIP